MERSMFREYDIRGLANDAELNPPNVLLIAKAFGTMLQKSGVTHVVSGRDSRITSPELQASLIEGLVSTGVHVTDIGLAISPLVYWAQYHLGVPGLAMVTGSHNPKEWNGLKLGMDYSSTIVGDQVQELFRLTESREFATGEGSLTLRSGIIEEYASDLASRVTIHRPMRVVVDAGNGTAGAVVPQVLRAAGVETIERFCDLDPTFPNHEPDPSTVAAISSLGEGVRQASATLGLGFDGDGDRLGVADECGEAVWPDRYMILLSRSILAEEAGAKIIFDVKCSQALEEDIRAHGGVPIMWKTGHSYIKAKMHEENAALAGEMSGHIFYARDYYGFDDAPFAALKLLEYVSLQDRTFSELIADTPYYISTPTIQVFCPDEVKYRIVEQLTADFKAEYEVIDINGARVLFGDGWGLVRASSNLPALVLRFEAKTAERPDEIQAIFREKLSAFDEVSTEWRT